MLFCLTSTAMSTSATVDATAAIATAVGWPRLNCCTFQPGPLVVDAGVVVVVVVAAAAVVVAVVGDGPVLDLKQWLLREMELQS